MTMPSAIAREAQKLATDRLVKLYEIDATGIGGVLFPFISATDPSMHIVSMTSSGYVATVTTENNHTMADGDLVQIINAAPLDYNGQWVVNVTGAKTFEFNLAVVPGINAIGNYMTAIRVNNTMPFGGKDYIPIAIEVTGLEWNGQGTQPTPTLKIARTHRLLNAAMVNLNNLTGAKFTRIRTFRKHLDDGADPDDTAVFPRDVYRINRKVAQNKLFMEFQLANPMDQEGAKIPGRVCLQNTCTHRYRVFNPDTGSFDYSRATCPYVGGTYFTANDVPTGSAANDRCGKTLNSCQARFGTAPLPTRAIPGIGGR